MPVRRWLWTTCRLSTRLPHPGVVVEHDVDEAHKLVVVLGEDGLSVGRCGEPRRPHRTAVGRDVAVEE